MLGYSLDVIHVIGGGSQNKLLCQLTADAAGIRVVAGPIEATAIGNAMMQAISLGYLDSLEQGRDFVGRSFPLQEYQPRTADGWNAAYERLLSLLSL